MSKKLASRVAIISSYVPRQCGIATFTHDLAVAAAKHVYNAELGTTDRVQIAAMNDREDAYEYDREVTVQIRQARRNDYRNAADILNTSHIGVVNVQHEYGLFGGTDGVYLFDLLERLRRPVVPTLHTVLSAPSEGQRNVLHRLCRVASKIIVLANRAKTLLTERYDVPAERIQLVHHGVPDIPFSDPDEFKARFDVEGRPTILTFGLLSSNKGIEVMLDALPRVVQQFPDLVYIILGITHPSVRRESGESYRLTLEQRAVELGIQNNVQFHNRFVSNEDLCEYLQAADIYVTPYPGKEQISSGTLAYALASGRAIVSTPYWYAAELLADGRGRLFDFGDSDGLSKQLIELLDDRETRNEIRAEAHAFGRRMTWSNVAREYAALFKEVQESFVDPAAPEAASSQRLLMRMSLPEPRLDHLLRMTDDTGMLQHALYATPERAHGYCTDDNTRAMIVAAMCWSLVEDERALPLLQVYLSFVQDAFMEDTGRFRNFMSFDRRWLEEDGSDDCQGRCFWSLGYLVSHAPDWYVEQLGAQLFQDAMKGMDTLQYPRAWALTILGLHYFLRKHPNHGDARKKIHELSDKLLEVFDRHASDDWPWFEDVVTYDNARLPQALIIGGLCCNRQDIVDRGLHVLQWLLDVQTDEHGHLAVVGNDGWLRRSGHRAVFDQQPLEVAALVGACKAAYRATNNEKWLVDMRRCFEWYLGRNVYGATMVDFKTRGCFDAIIKQGPNRNQGAEALLSWLLSLLIMHEMQEGDAPEAATADMTLALNPG